MKRNVFWFLVSLIIIHNSVFINAYERTGAAFLKIGIGGPHGDRGGTEDVPHLVDLGGCLVRVVSRLTTDVAHDLVAPRVVLFKNQTQQTTTVDWPADGPRRGGLLPPAAFRRTFPGMKPGCSWA